MRQKIGDPGPIKLHTNFPHTSVLSKSLQLPYGVNKSNNRSICLVVRNLTIPTPPNHPPQQLHMACNMTRRIYMHFLLRPDVDTGRQCEQFSETSKHAIFHDIRKLLEGARSMSFIPDFQISPFCPGWLQKSYRKLVLENWKITEIDEMIGWANLFWYTWFDTSSNFQYFFYFYIIYHLFACLPSTPVLLIGCSICGRPLPHQQSLHSGEARTQPTIVPPQGHTKVPIWA